ncbi:hypothetical protein [Lysinibacillus sp. G4S2]|uniref:hypothetical protein n=1 Tax=Lysinibacillus sp. G4S2 TaxID=3055859 RepID=UPI0025A2F47B|nr:hypothetical protein [Lysinibacillus sp. G4S2]MDM5250029.1 hypothetical protein [Lysinibacillus sp. G4S2]
MFETGTRIIYNQLGELIAVIHDVASDTHQIIRPDIAELYCIDLPYGEIGDDRYVVGVDPETKEVLYKYFDRPLSPEQKIKELEDELLLQTEKEVGGIL